MDEQGEKKSEEDNKDKTLESTPPTKDEAQHQSSIFNHSVDHRGTHIYVRGQIPTQSPNAPIIIIHNIGSSSTPYRDAAKEFADLGHPTFVFDQRGHGRSGRLLGDLENYHHLTNDLLQISAWVRYRCGRKAPYILAHGLGALGAVHFAAKHPDLCKGLALVWPQLTAPSSLGRRFIIRGLCETFPKLRLPHKLTPVWMQLHKQNFTYATNRFVKEIIESLEAIPGSFSKIQCPTFLVNPPEGNRSALKKVFEMIGRHEDKNLFETKALDIAPDEVLQDKTASSELFEVLSTWFDEHKDHTPIAKTNDVQIDTPTEESTQNA